MSPVKGGDQVSVASGGVFVTDDGGGGARPSSPAMSLAVSGDTVTASITGDVGATHYLLHIKDGESGWTAAGNRSGDGDIEVSGLADGVYAFTAYSLSAGSVSSLPAPGRFATVFSAVSEVVPTGAMGKAMVNLRNLVAESTTFQDAVGATGSSAEKIAFAKTRVYLADYIPDDDFEHPYAVICSTGDDNSEMVGVAAFGDGGSLELWLYDDIPAGYQADDQASNAEMNFKNFAGGVVADCQELSGLPGYLLASKWRTAEGPARTENDDMYGVKLQVSWGLEF